MAEAVAIRVIIGLRPNGDADHPDWTILPLAGTGTQPEREAIIKTHQIRSWVYDKTSGHSSHSVDSPRGTQLGMMLVTDTLADEAVAMWPTLVTIMTETEAEAFWDDKGHGHLNDDRLDPDQLTGLQAECDLIEKMQAEFPGEPAWAGRKTACLAKMRNALDADHPSPGIRKQKTKKWVDAKVDLDFTIKVP